MQRFQVRNKVKAKVGEELLDELVEYVKDDEPNLWGEQQPPDHFQEDMVLLTIYKDMTGDGFEKLEKDIDFGYKITHQSLHHNIQVLRDVLREYALENMKVGTLHAWKKAAKKCGLGAQVQDANLWMDSTDIRILKQKGYGKRSTKWSYKSNYPGRRFMAIRDGLGRIVKIWGGYSPKVYDSDFLDSHRQEIETTFKGGVVLADNHFRRSGKTFKNVKFYTNYAKREKVEKDMNPEEKEADWLDTITKAQVSFNNQHRKARARIEIPFGWIKRNFKTFGKPWAEPEEQLDNLVYICACIYNSKMNKKT